VPLHAIQGSPQKLEIAALYENVNSISAMSMVLPDVLVIVNVPSEYE